MNVELVGVPKFGVFTGVLLSIGAGGSCEGEEYFICVGILLFATVLLAVDVEFNCVESPGCLGMAKRKVCLAASLRAGANLYDDGDDVDVVVLVEEGADCAVEVNVRPAPTLLRFALAADGELVLCVVELFVLFMKVEPAERPACGSFVLKLLLFVVGIFVVLPPYNDV